VGSTRSPRANAAITSGGPLRMPRLRTWMMVPSSVRIA